MLGLASMFYLGVDLVQYGIAGGCIDDTKHALWHLVGICYAEPGHIDISMRHGIGHPGLTPAFRAECARIVELHRQIDHLTFLGGGNQSFDYGQNTIDACHYSHDFIVATNVCSPGEFVNHLPTLIELADQAEAMRALISLGEVVLAFLG